MSYFEQIYALAKDLCNPEKQEIARKELSILLLKPNVKIDCMDMPMLTPAAALARDGYLNEAFVLHEKFQANIDKIYYGAIIGGYFSDFESIQQDYQRRKPTNHLKESPTFMVALAQRGYEQKVLTFLEALPKESKQEFMNAALKGVTLGRNKKLLQVLANQCIDSINFSFSTILRVAAWRGDEDFILELLKKHSHVKASNRESILDLQKEIMGGLASGNHSNSINKLITMHQYPHETIGSAVEWAATYKHYDLAIKLAVEYSFQKKLLDTCHWDFKLLELLLIKDPNISDKNLEIVVHNAAIDGEHFIRWLAHASDQLLFERLLRIAQKLDVDNYLINRARTVLKLKREYGLEVEQAFFFQLQYSQLMPIFESKVSTLEEMLVAVEMVNKLNAQLNQEQVDDMVERIVQNKFRPLLIQKIEDYISKCSRFFSSHQGRATSFLNKLTQVDKAAECHDLVTSQYRMFHVKADAKVNSTEKYLKPLKNPELKDNYYKALEEYYHATNNL